jgi:hypothetical protein
MRATASAFAGTLGVADEQRERPQEAPVAQPLGGGRDEARGTRSARWRWRNRGGVERWTVRPPRQPAPRSARTVTLGLWGAKSRSARSPPVDKERRSGASRRRRRVAEGRAVGNQPHATRSLATCRSAAERANAPRTRAATSDADRHGLGEDWRAWVQSRHGAHGQDQEVARDGEEEGLTAPRASNGVSWWLAPQSGSGPSPQPTDARCARGEELQANGGVAGPASCLRHEIRFP